MPHLTYSECVAIQVFLEEGYSHRKIARKLWKSNRTISQEIKKYSSNGLYRAHIAKIVRKTRRTIANIFLHRRIIPNTKLETYIIEKTQEYRSPDQIAWNWKRETWESLSKDTIYRYIYLQHPEFIKKYFRRKWKKYKYGTVLADYIRDRQSIHARPKIDSIWHREWDTMWWAKRKWWFVTFNEIKSGYLLAGPMEEKRAKNVTFKAHELFSKIPHELKKTLTLDNGREFVEHYMLKELCWLDTYFADIWNPWQRWANENTNWLLRQFYPKWYDLWKVTQKELDYYVNLLNNRPRKRLWYLSPIEFLLLNHCVLLN